VQTGVVDTFSFDQRLPVDPIGAIVIVNDGRIIIMSST